MSKEVEVTGKEQELYPTKRRNNFSHTAYRPASNKTLAARLKMRGCVMLIPLSLENFSILYLHPPPLTSLIHKHLHSSLHHRRANRARYRSEKWTATVKKKDFIVWWQFGSSVVLFFSQNTRQSLCCNCWVWQFRHLAFKIQGQYSGPLSYIRVRRVFFFLSLSACLYMTESLQFS